MTKPLTVLCVNGESDPAETGSFIEMYKAGVDITVITWPTTFNYDALIKAGVPTEKSGPHCGADAVVVDVVVLLVLVHLVN